MSRKLNFAFCEIGTGEANSAHSVCFVQIFEANSTRRSGFCICYAIQSEFGFLMLETDSPACVAFLNRDLKRIFEAFLFYFDPAIHNHKQGRRRRAHAHTAKQASKQVVKNNSTRIRRPINHR